MEKLEDRHSAPRADGSPNGERRPCSREPQPGLPPAPRTHATLISLLLAAAFVLVLAPSSALGLTQRGHEFSTSFGEKGAGLGALDGPAGVAVDEATGDVYVVDAGNQRVERFSSSGEAQEVWGWGVKSGAAEFQRCVKGETCQAGIAGTGEGQFDYPAKLKGHARAALAIAVDNSTSGADPSKGDVYVVSNTVSAPNVVQKFSATGTPLGHLPLAAPTVGGVAVDAHGVVWVQVAPAESGTPLEELSEFERFTDAQPNTLIEPVVKVAERPPHEENEPVPALHCPVAGFAIDAAGRALYLNHERFGEREGCFAEEEEANEAEAEEAHEEKIEGFKRKRAVLTSVTAKLSVLGEPPSEAQVLTFAEVEIDAEQTSAIAVDETGAAPSLGDVYLDNEAFVTAFDASGAFIQTFGSAQLKAGGGAGIAIDGATQDVFVADSKKSRIDVFVPEAVGPPTVDSLSYLNIEPTKTELKALVDPHGEAPAEYYFEYGTQECPSSACKKVVPAQTLTAGFGDEEVSAIVEVVPATTYFYRFEVKDAHGSAVAGGIAHTFTTLPLAQGLLADNRQWELVTPSEKLGFAPEAIGGIGEQGPSPSASVIEASENGEAITYGLNGPPEHNPQGNRSPESQQAISSRTPAGWSTKDIDTPVLQSEGVQIGEPAEYQIFSSDLSLGALAPWGLTENRLQEPPLTRGPNGEVPGSEQRGVYLRHNFNNGENNAAGYECEANASESCIQPLITAATEFGGPYQVLGASSDLKHIVFRPERAFVKLLPEASGNDDMYEWNADKPASERLALVNVLPTSEGKQEVAAHGTAAGLGGTFGAQAGNARNAVSSDGTRVTWTESSEGVHLYSRNMTTGNTIDIGQPEEGVEPVTGEAFSNHAYYQAASADGKRIFFTDDAPLTRTSNLLPRATGELAQSAPTDLYVCEIVEEKCNLTDLTSGTHGELAEYADVTRLIPGASEDGTYVYFVANGSLSAGAVKGDCATESITEVPPGATCNLYEDHSNGSEWERPKLIAVLSTEDSPDWGAAALGLSETISRISSRVSPHGLWFAFMSKRPLIGGTHNEDAVSHASDEEVYLYDATRERVICASCNPSGASSRGVFDTRTVGEGLGLLADRPGAWRGQTLAGSIPTWTYATEHDPLYQSRYLSDEGRLFFNSPDKLVSLPEAGGKEEAYDYKENVYEYEPQGVSGGTCADAGGCVSLISSGTSERESAFLDASTDGASVFFITYSQLVSTDHDHGLDVYNARVCTGASPCIQSPPAAKPPCQTTESCRPEFNAPPAFVVAPPSGAGNVPKTIVREEPKPKTVHHPTPLQVLKKALKKCHKVKSHKKRAACEKLARKRYHAKVARLHGSRR